MGEGTPQPGQDIWGRRGYPKVPTPPPLYLPGQDRGLRGTPIYLPHQVRTYWREEVPQGTYPPSPGQGYGNRLFPSRTHPLSLRPESYHRSVVATNRPRIRSWKKIDPPPLARSVRGGGGGTPRYLPPGQVRMGEGTPSQVRMGGGGGTPRYLPLPRPGQDRRRGGTPIYLPHQVRTARELLGTGKVPTPLPPAKEVTGYSRLPIHILSA